jgi:hypothetical protein
MIHVIMTQDLKTDFEELPSLSIIGHFRSRLGVLAGSNVPEYLRKIFRLASLVSSHDHDQLTRAFTITPTPLHGSEIRERSQPATAL